MRGCGLWSSFLAVVCWCLSDGLTWLTPMSRKTAHVHDTKYSSTASQLRRHQAGGKEGFTVSQVWSFKDHPQVHSGERSGVGGSGGPEHIVDVSDDAGLLGGVEHDGHHDGQHQGTQQCDVRLTAKPASQPASRDQSDSRAAGSPAVGGGVVRVTYCMCS